MDCSPPGSSVHGISQAKILENGLPFPSPGGLPDPGTEPTSPALQQVLYCWTTSEAQNILLSPQVISLLKKRSSFLLIIYLPFPMLFILAHSFFQCFNISFHFPSFSTIWWKVSHHLHSVLFYVSFFGGCFQDFLFITGFQRIIMCLGVVFYVVICFRFAELLWHIDLCFLLQIWKITNHCVFFQKKTKLRYNSYTTHLKLTILKTRTQ